MAERFEVIVPFRSDIGRRLFDVHEGQVRAMCRVHEQDANPSGFVAHNETGKSGSFQSERRASAAETPSGHSKEGRLGETSTIFEQARRRREEAIARTLRKGRTSWV